ncbi:MAG: RNA methyltransferase [Lachnospiraceae bacterium]|nr:RNA methyltransferase [Lachnospiraceae bacterium]
MITSPSNSKIKHVAMLQKDAGLRKMEALFVTEGFRMTSEVPPVLLRELYLSESAAGKPEYADLAKKLTDPAGGYTGEEVCIVADKAFERMCDTKHPQGICAVVSKPSYKKEDIFPRQANGKERYLILENVQDPGNVGTMVRTAEAAGMTAVLFAGTCADLFNPKTIRSTMGSLFRVPFLHFSQTGEMLELLKNRGIRTFAAALEGSVSYRDAVYGEKCAVMIGNEGNGLSKEAISLADERIRIPMEGKVESLNASISAAVLMYEMGRE